MPPPAALTLYGLLLAFLPNQRLVDVRDHTWGGRKTPRITPRGKRRKVASRPSNPYLRQQWWLWSRSPALRRLWWPVAGGVGLYASPSGPWTHSQPVPTPWTEAEVRPLEGCFSGAPALPPRWDTPGWRRCTRPPWPPPGRGWWFWTSGVCEYALPGTAVRGHGF